jgi:uncharacterized protein YkwD
MVSASAQTKARYFDPATSNIADPLFPDTTKNLQPKTEEKPTVVADHKLEHEVFELLNAERVRRGLTELPWSDEVAKVARIHSDNMASGKFFSHRGSDGSMVDDRADRVGLSDWRLIGENIAYVRGFENPAKTAVEKWLESTAHRNNLLGTTWQESAVAVAITADGTIYMTQVFLFRK